MKKYLPVILFVLSILFLIPGITLPLMTIEATVNNQEMLNLAAKSLLPSQQNGNFLQSMLQSVVQQAQVEGSTKVFESTRSLLATMRELIFHDHVIVGLLIGLFALIIPVIKISLSLSTIFLDSSKRIQLLKISSLLGKWSMSDVFVMAIIVAFFTINANEQSINAVQMKAELRQGFYYFVIYCLLAIAAGQLLEKQAIRNNNKSLEQKR